MTDVTTRVFAPPGDLVTLTSSEPLLFGLAERLWEPAATGNPGHSGNAIAIEVVRGSTGAGNTGDYEDFLEGAREDGAAAPGSPRPDAAASSILSFEERLRWVHGASEIRCEVPGVLNVRIDLVSTEIRAALAPGLSLSLSKEPPFPPPSSLPLPLSKKSFSLSSSLASFLARTLLEAPAAVLLARRGWRALHAGGVSGPKGAVVLRGGSGAGKSTLVAAAHAAGLTVLGDESLFVARGDPDALAASVRELTLRADSAALLGILASTMPAFSGGEEKRRVELFEGSRPGMREARRVTTLLLGPRTPGPARLVPLAPAQFLSEFAVGEIPQEHVDGGAGAVARAWADAGGARLDGASDLAGAVSLLKGLVS
ncbi:MAG: hypothetical protein NEA02_04370 [Thermoanaerobaculia bacterium]|nr:hypothetical protein [Thermoanaerobaculia bacterium]